MQASPAKILLAYLQGTTYLGSWKAFVGKLSRDQEDCIAFVDTGSRSAGPREGRWGSRSVRPSVQVLIRATDERDGYDIGATLESAFDKVGISQSYGGDGDINLTLDSQTYSISDVMVATPTARVGTEPETGRTVFSINTYLTWTPPDPLFNFDIMSITDGGNGTIIVKTRRRHTIQTGGGVTISGT